MSGATVVLTSDDTLVRHEQVHFQRSVHFDLESPIDLARQADPIQAEESGRVSGMHGEWFRPPLRIDAAPWFKALRNHLGNFAFGLRRIIHVHHLRPISECGGEDYEVDPITELRPVCPNCHVVLHRRNPPFSIAELQRMLSGSR